MAVVSVICQMLVCVDLLSQPNRGSPEEKLGFLAGRHRREGGKPGSMGREAPRCYPRPASSQKQRDVRDRAHANDP